MSGVNLLEIGPTWRARMKGTYWGSEMPEVAGKTVECIRLIGPTPDRFMFRLPKRLPGRKVLVFSADDVENWSPPES